MHLILQPWDLDPSKGANTFFQRYVTRITHTLRGCSKDLRKDYNSSDELSYKQIQLINKLAYWKDYCLCTWSGLVH